MGYHGDTTGKTINYSALHILCMLCINHRPLWLKVLSLKELYCIADVLNAWACISVCISWNSFAFLNVVIRYYHCVPKCMNICINGIQIDSKEGGKKGLKCHCVFYYTWWLKETYNDL